MRQSVGVRLLFIRNDGACDGGEDGEQRRRARPPHRAEGCGRAVDADDVEQGAQQGPDLIFLAFGGL